MAEPQFRPGFRLSALDVAILLAGATASVYAAGIERWFGVAVAFVVLHFFLFCNVLRMARPLELAWAGLFVVLSATASFGYLTWPSVFAASLLMTVFVAVMQARAPSYHGVGWQRMNPRLPDWWQLSRASDGPTNRKPAGVTPGPAVRT